MKHIPENIILSRTDSIGDMILTLPMAKILKNHFPDIKVYFLGREYTRAVVNTCRFADGFIERNEFLNSSTIKNLLIDTIIHVKPDKAVAKKAKKLKIKKRIGTTNRIFHWNNCNVLVPFSRKRSNLHEAQLNIKLLKPLGIDNFFTIKEIAEAYGFNNLELLKEEYTLLIDKGKYNLILHPKSRGSAREWGFDNFEKLVNSLDKNHYKIFISGTAEEGKLLQPLLKNLQGSVTDITGKLSLGQCISFIAHCDGLVACSTGPLHIAAALGKDAYGVYAPLKSIRPQRWSPIGNKASYFVLNKACEDCFKNKMRCHCIKEIDASIIKTEIEKNVRLVSKYF